MLIDFSPRPAEKPKGRPIQFTPLVDFSWPGTRPSERSSYMAGMTYTIWPGNDSLAARVDEWVLRGMVAITQRAKEGE
jgi:hypothetical protein